MNLIPQVDKAKIALLDVAAHDDPKCDVRLDGIGRVSVFADTWSVTRWYFLGEYVYRYDIVFPPLIESEHWYRRKNDSSMWSKWEKVLWEEQ